jgi:glutamine---fructose-6-phosphate transaminase (isomerizing)
MLEETLEAPAAVARQLSATGSAHERLVASLRGKPPHGLLTLARGSSDHAAHYMAYLVMVRLGRLVTSLPPSVMTLYHSALRDTGVMSLAFSQSGQSPDLITSTESLRRRGLRTVAFVNDENSPLAQAAEFVCPLHAGPERSVAATKSYVAQLAAGARLVADWQGDAALTQALAQLPRALEHAALLGTSQAPLQSLEAVDRLMIVGRGPGLAVAQELALKFKETCGIQAEAFSGAELQHGPMVLTGPDMPVIVLAPRGPAQTGLLTLAHQLQERGSLVYLATPKDTPIHRGLNWLPLAATAHEDLDPIAMVQTLYPMIEALARARGRNPDAPPHLAKVTKTR